MSPTLPKTLPGSAELLERNVAYAVNHRPLPVLKDIQASGPFPPKTCIITCVDPRVRIEEILGLQVGETFIFRTIAGHPQPVLEDVVTLDAQGQNTMKEVMIVYHTDCGSQQFDVPMIRAELAARDPASVTRIEQKTFGAINEKWGNVNLEHALREDVKWMKGQSLMRGEGIDVKGFMYDIESGKISQVV